MSYTMRLAKVVKSVDDFTFGMRFIRFDNFKNILFIFFSRLRMLNFALNKN